ncbi:hypothetical protein M426DRAFT_19906 [Hypoxylon sp. CI-4A]|nr:hypothetical protein M426DRAFT_19906 [Hypoxylon sp. CI-4A]
MASDHNVEDIDSLQWEMESNGHPYPPPEALPQYVNRALPPRPRSNTSFSLGSSTRDPQHLPAEKQDTPVTHPQGDQPSSDSVLDEAGSSILDHIQSRESPEPLLHQRNQQQPDIISPQPRYPAPIVLEIKEQHDMVSPLSAGLNTNQEYEVSPVSPGESECSIDSTISESDGGDIGTNRNSPLITGPIDSLRHKDGKIIYHTAHSSGDLAAARLVSPHQLVQQINLRYSDPGSPISGAVIHPPSPFLTDDVDPRLSQHIENEKYEGRREPPATLNSTPHEDPARGNPTHTSTSTARLAPNAMVNEDNSTPRVVFAGPEGFSTRSRANSKKTNAAPPPPPLKLSERPLVETYVKTPFPGSAVPPLQRGNTDPDGRLLRRGKSVGGDGNRGGGKGVKEKEKGKGKGKGGGVDGGEDEDGIRPLNRRNRVSSLPGLGSGFTKLLRQASVHHGSGGGSSGGSGSRAGEIKKDGESHKERTSPMPKVKSILAKAKQLKLGRGFGLGMGSEEARKEKRRAEMKKLIRVGEPRPS